MIDVLIRRPHPKEHDSVLAVVQTVVDEIYGGLWASPPLPLDEENWHSFWSLYGTRKSSEWFGQAENGWMTYGCFAKAGDMG
jgi:hypothetical protein